MSSNSADAVDRPDGNLNRLSRARRDSLGQQVYKSIRLGMLRGQFEQGQLYSESWLAETLAASRTPIREALRQLEHEGLVEIIPQRGFRMREVSPAEIREFYALREMLECYVVGTLCDEAGDGSLDPALRELSRILERQRESIDDLGEFVARDEEFHLTMAHLARLPRTARMISSLRGVLWLLAARIMGNQARREAVLDEHSAILVAIQSHQRKQAVQAMTRHVRETARLASASPVPTQMTVGLATAEGLDAL
ncbi:MAG TPA: GntR family transcriptional regulator [Candidatus Dormibacteraeota bacterium]|nr:GntR family transcriptional regulator [Candidatus Dormibacteraeota bacterium]